MSPLIVLNDVMQNKYKNFFNNNKEEETNNINTDNKVFWSSPKLKVLFAESNDSNNFRVNKMDRFLPKLSNSSLLSTEGDDIDHSNASDSTCLDSEEMYPAHKKRKSNATLVNSNNSIAKVGKTIRFDCVLPKRKKQSTLVCIWFYHYLLCACLCICVFVSLLVFLM